MKREKLAAVGSVIAAIAASICCIGPLIALLLGTSSLAAASSFAQWRPVFLGVTFVLLAGAWYLTYRKPKGGACAEGTVCATKPAAKWNKVMLWIATILVVALAMFPLYAGAVARWLHPDKPRASLTDASGLATMKVKIPSMDCDACAANIQRTLLKQNGILDAQVTFKTKEAVVQYDAGKLSPEKVIAAIDDTGFRAEPTRKEKP